MKNNWSYPSYFLLDTFLNFNVSKILFRNNIRKKKQTFFFAHSSDSLILI